VLDDAVARAQAIEAVATHLLPRASKLTRLLLRAGPRELTRTEAGLLLGLSEGPRRITELAEAEALAQPTVTQLVDKLERRGLVRRDRSSKDGRVVLVSASAEGHAQLKRAQAQTSEHMRRTVQTLSDEELADLVTASEILDRLIDGFPRIDGA
jgi:DNA-binding MarR family transcriptional regulator